MTMAESTDFDVVVIGGGPGGYAAALYGSLAGLRIAVVERDKVGGLCLHRGCVPAKEFLETAAVARSVAGAKDFGIHAGPPSVDFAVSQARKQKIVEQLYQGLAGLMKHRGITVFTGTGTLLPGRLVRVDDAGGSSQLAGRHVVLASGSVARGLPGFDVDGTVVLTSDEVLDLDHLPASVAVIGGGLVGCEFASMFCDLGVRVTVLEAGDTLLPACDRDIVARVARSFAQRGITVHTGIQVRGHNRSGPTTTVSFGDASSGDARPVTVDAVVVAVGRRPSTDGLLADGTGVTVDEHGFVVVDDHMRTTAPGVWAVGDVVNTPQLAHVGFAEGILTIKGILGEPAEPVEYSRVAWCVYCHPEVAYAGLTEADAHRRGIDVVVQKYPLGGNSRARIIGDITGLVKVVAARQADGSAGPILGVQMVGPWVTELLGQAYLAVNTQATPDQIGRFIQPHPTLSESFGEIMLALTGRGLHLG
jgi:dihydrolipoyl dehydrogenase